MPSGPEEKFAAYQRKRDFEATPEPAPEQRRRKKGAPRFVVQEHSAVTSNRKAVRTEDHPLEYLEWEGEIPKGSTGRGR